MTVDTKNLASTMSVLIEHFEPRSIAREARARARMAYVPKRADGHVSFVAVGRLSPEKNHDRLLRAFSRVHERHPETRLVILGDGRLMPEVSALVAQLGLQEVVSLAGHVDNPYALMVECDCFVISSNYEGPADGRARSEDSGPACHHHQVPSRSQVRFPRARA